MARIAILTLAGAGHVYPTGSLGRELRRRGHTVTLLTHEAARPLAERLELPLRPLPAPQTIPRPPRDLLRLAAVPLSAMWGTRLLARLLRNAWLVLRGVPAILREIEADAVLVDKNILAGGTVAEYLGLPYVTVCSAMMGHGEPGVPPAHTGWRYSTSRLARVRNTLAYAGARAYSWPVTHAINAQRRVWGLPPIRRPDGLLSPYAQISQLVPEFDYPRAELPDTCHYVGALASSRAVDEGAFPWKRLDGRPLIFASLGTVSYRSNLRTFRAIAAACAGLDAQLVLTLGKWTDARGNRREELGDLAGNPLVVDFAPQLALLERTAVLITHAGQNTVLEALHAGVPMVALPRSADQPGLAARIEYTGVGLRDSFYRPHAGRLRQKIHRVLTDETFRRRAGELQQAVAAAGGAAYAADVVERVLATRGPVTRAAMNGNDKQP